MGGFDDYALADGPAVGPTGAVSWARHVATGRAVAVTELTPRAATDQAFLRRLRATAATLAKVDHPNVLPIREVVEGQAVGGGERVWVVEDWLEGRELGEVLVDGRLTAEQSVALTCGVLRGLTAVHGKGVVHGDVSTASIVIAAGGVPRLVGFGFAGMPGRPPADSASDVLAAASVLRDLLAGGARHPQLEAVVAKATSDRPKDRPKKAAALLSMVEKAARSDFGKGWAPKPSLAQRASDPPAVATGDIRSAATELLVGLLTRSESEDAGLDASVDNVAGTHDPEADAGETATDSGGDLGPVSDLPEGEPAGDDGEDAPGEAEPDAADAGLDEVDGATAATGGAAAADGAPAGGAVAGSFGDAENANEPSIEPIGRAAAPEEPGAAADLGVGERATTVVGEVEPATEAAAADRGVGERATTAVGGEVGPATEGAAAADVRDGEPATVPSDSAGAGDAGGVEGAGVDGGGAVGATGTDVGDIDSTGSTEAMAVHPAPKPEPTEPLRPPANSATATSPAAARSVKPAAKAPAKAGPAAKKTSKKARNKKPRTAPTPTAPAAAVRTEWAVPVATAPAATQATPTPTGKGGKRPGRRPQSPSVVRGLTGTIMILIGAALATTVERHQTTETSSQPASPRGVVTTLGPATGELATPAQVASSDITGAWTMRLAVFESTGFFGTQVGQSVEKTYTIRSDCTTGPCVLKLVVSGTPGEFDLRRQPDEYVLAASGPQDCIDLATGALRVANGGVASVTVHLRPTSASRTPRGDWSATGLSGSVVTTFDTTNPGCPQGSGVQRSTAVGTRQ